jgi:hypothetical protein
MTKFQTLVFALFLMLASNTVFAQDSTRYEVYDVIYLKDNRVLKGQILSYDSQLGGISFKDIYGRVYNFSREQYSYFKEKQNFPIKVKSKKQKVIFDRKSKGLRYSLGFNTSYFYGLEKSDNADLNSRKDTQGTAIGVSGSIGKYFTRTHFLGLNAEIGLLTNNHQLYNLGVRYNYEYDKRQSNVAKYIPIEIKYQHMFLQNSRLNYVENIPYPYVAGYYPTTEFSTVFLSVGHGFGFILKQGGSFNIELAYQRHFTLSQKFYDLKPQNEAGYNPKFSQINGFRLGFSFSF